LCDDGSDLPATYAVVTQSGSSYNWTIPTGWTPSSNPTTSSTYTLTAYSTATTKTINVTTTRGFSNASCSRTVSFIDCDPGCHPCKQADFSDLDNITLYPVPADEYLTVKVTDGLIGGTIEIIDAIGRIRKKSIINDFYPQIETSNLSEGVYFFAITSKGQYKVIPFEVSH
jgi:hypothetical protein